MSSDVPRAAVSAVVRTGVLALPLPLRRALLVRRRMGVWPRLRHPVTFNDKVNWRICYDRRPLLEWTCDKDRMKGEARARDPHVLVPATLWSGESVDDLARVDFPDRWVLKPNHSSQVVHIGRGQPTLDDLERLTAGWLDVAHERFHGEWAYATARRAILLEEFIGDGDQPPVDYKFFCFDGEVAMVQVDVGRFSTHEIALYDPSWQRVDASKRLVAAAPPVPRPDQLDAMLQHAATLSEDFDFIRIDLFATERGIWFGEYTPYPGAGLSAFEPRAFDVELGSRWRLPTLSNAQPVAR